MNSPTISDSPKSQLKESPTFSPESVVRKFPKVLLVDDSKFLADVLATFFQLDGFVARSAYGGQEALEACRNELPDIAFIDLAMPGLDGLEVARQIKATYQSNAPVLVALTGWDGDENRHAATEAGFDHFLEKPVDPVSLRCFMSDLAEHDTGVSVH
ncbi:MAG: response regulator [Verrucomicrobiota bacterium]